MVTVDGLHMHNESLPLKSSRPIIICGSLPPIRALSVDIKNKTWASRPQ